jgi:cytosine deaminase
MSIIIRNCRIFDKTVDILLESGIISRINEKIDAKGDEEIDAGNRLVLPSFVEPHVHLDKAFLAENLQEAKNMAEARKLVREAKSNFSRDDVAKRAEKCIIASIQNGVTYMRSHVDIDSIAGLKSFEALLGLKKKFEKYLTLQIVAFPQEGVFRDEGAFELIESALDRGADAIGGLPEAEVDREKGIEHIKKMLNLAAERKVPVDMHIDVQPYTNYIEYFIAEVKKHKLDSATADHLIALAYYDDSYASKVIAMIKDAGINVVSNPCTAMVSGGGASPPLARGVTRIKELLRAGVNIAFGLDNIVDPYNPFGDFDPLRNAWLFAYEGQLNSKEDMVKLLQMPTYNSARILGLRGYGIEQGCKADLNILQARNPRDALRLAAKPSHIIRSGRIIAAREEKLTLNLDT